FGQIAPRVLVTVDGYQYNTKVIDLRARVAQIVNRLAAIERVVVLPYVDRDADISMIPKASTWAEFVATSRDTAPIEYRRLPFDHPLYVMYASGTTGLPKCMVHGAGGTLMQHLKELVLHTDLTRDDRMFYFTTCGWMMWNWLVS